MIRKIFFAVYITSLFWTEMMNAAVGDDTCATVGTSTSTQYINSTIT